MQYGSENSDEGEDRCESGATAITVSREICESGYLPYCGRISFSGKENAAMDHTECVILLLRFLINAVFYLGGR